MSVLEIKDLHVEIEGKEILKGVNLTLKTGEIAAIMGPNGTGKSTLSAAIMGNPNYEVTKGEVLFDDVNILELEVDERARMGLFLAMQYPSEIPGITNAEFLRAAMNAGKEDDEKISVREFITKLDEKMELLNMKEEMAERYLNEGFSGGEKKRNEILQLLMLEPTFALLDEIDSGLDIDALKVVSKGVNAMRGEGFGAMIITHYQRLLNYITPDVVHVMMEGRVVLSGGPELAARLEREGYAKLAKENIKLFSEMHAEPSWLADLRQKAFDKIESLELPVIERVKFHRWNLGDGTITESEPSANVPDFTALDNHLKLVQVGTQTVFEQTPVELAEQGVVFTDFHSALEEIPELIKEFFMSSVKYDDDKLAAYHTAYFNSGAVLYIPDNVEIKEPIEGIFYQDSDSDVPFNKHIMIIAGKNSKISYLERLESRGEGSAKATANITVEVIARSGAQVKFAAIDRLGENVTAYISRRGKLGNDASIDWAIGVMNEGNVVADFDSDLIGNGSHADLKVVALSSGRQVQGIDTRVTNYGCNSIGNILQHGVILEKATLTFNGIGHIIKGAKGADAQQESRVLMLSDQARSDANPILLIDENDVTAGHAASIGQVDPEDMYYLMSRGLDKATAERLVVRGFLGSVIVEIPVKEVRDEMIATIEEKLSKR